MTEMLTYLIVAAGIGQLLVLTAAALVPFRLNWPREFAQLPRLHRQMYWVYGGYVVYSIVALALVSLLRPAELASGGALARAVCLYAALFWGVRLALQAVFDARPYLTAAWLKVGYHSLTVMFAGLTAIYAWAAVA